MTDRDRLTEYEWIVKDGGVVVAVYADDDDEKRQLAEVFHRHGGQHVRYYGAFTVEDLGAEADDEPSA